MAQAAEIRNAAGPPGPTLIWRAADAVGARPQPGRSLGEDRHAMVMRAEAERSREARAPVAQGLHAGMPSRTGMDGAAASLPMPMTDLNQVAERVMRLIARRLAVERERRGGKQWI
jgi:hypothetical protein